MTFRHFLNSSPVKAINSCIRNYISRLSVTYSQIGMLYEQLFYLRLIYSSHIGIAYTSHYCVYIIQFETPLGPYALKDAGITTE